MFVAWGVYGVVCKRWYDKHSVMCDDSVHVRYHVTHYAIPNPVGFKAKWFKESYHFAHNLNVTIEIFRTALYRFTSFLICFVYGKTILYWNE